MRKLIASASIVAVAAMGLGFSASTASAANFCYNLSPFSDILNVQAAKKKNGHRLLYGTWSAGGSYTLPVAGALEKEVVGGATRVGVTGTNNTTSFGDNVVCGLDGFPDGPWEANCAGGPSGPFQVSGDSLTVVPCGAPGKSKGAPAGG